VSDTSPQKKSGRTWPIILGTLIVFVLAVYGVGQVLELFWRAPTVAMCDGKPMGPYDKCGSYRPGSDTAQSVTDATSQLQGDQFGHSLYVYLTAFGIVVALAFAVSFLLPISRADEKTSRTSTPHN
jgi:flagellar basal body-associated protein FliL